MGAVLVRNANSDAVEVTGMDDKTIKLERFDKTAVYSDLNGLKQPAAVKKNARRKKIALIAGGTVLILLLGCFMAAYYHDEQIIADQKRLQQQPQELGEKKANEAAANRINTRVDKVQSNFPEVNIPQEEIKEKVTEAGKQVKQVVTAAKLPDSQEKVQSLLKENAGPIKKVTIFLQNQLDRLQLFLDHTMKSLNN